MDKLFPDDAATFFTAPEKFAEIIPSQCQVGPQNPKWKIPPVQWPAILERIEKGERLQCIAEEYGVTYATIRKAEKAARQAFNVEERLPHLWKIPASEWAAILQHIDTGETFTQIAKEYGVSRASIRRIEKVARQALNAPERQPHYRGGISPTQWPIIVQRIDGGDTFAQIAEDYHISQTSVRRIEKEARADLNTQARPVYRHGKIPSCEWSSIVQQRKQGLSLRKIASSYEVSDATIRRILRLARE